MSLTHRGELDQPGVAEGLGRCHPLVRLTKELADKVATKLRNIVELRGEELVEMSQGDRSDLA